MSVMLHMCVYTDLMRARVSTQHRSGIGKTKRKGRVVVGETGSELDVYMKV